MERKQRKPDRRVIKTKKAIHSAFIDLLIEKEIYEITIKSLADHAGVDRKTIYNYYSGVYDILEEIENELIEDFQSVLKDLNYEYSIENPYRIFETLSNVLNSNIELYSKLMKIDSQSHVTRKIVTSLKGNVRNALLHMKNSPFQSISQVDFVSEYITSGMLRVFQNWFNSVERPSLEEFSTSVGILVISGIKGFISK